MKDEKKNPNESEQSRSTEIIEDGSEPKAETPAESQAPDGDRAIDQAMAPLRRLIFHRKLIIQAMKEYLQEGSHYGSLPGMTQKVLLKPGADALTSLFQLRATFERERIDYPGGHREYIMKCVLLSKDGEPITEAHGSCSTMEPKYRYRWADRTCPVCGKAAIKISKFDEGNFYCYAKIGGCGAKFDSEDERLTSQVVGKVETADPAEHYNTILKMSEKRAKNGAIFQATGCADMFCQDLEIVPEYSHLFNPDGTPKAPAAPTLADVMAKAGISPSEESRLSTFIALTVRQLREKGKAISYQDMLLRALDNPDNLKKAYREYVAKAAIAATAAKEPEPAKAPKAAEAAKDPESSSEDPIEASSDGVYELKKAR